MEDFAKLIRDSPKLEAAKSARFQHMLNSLLSESEPQFEDRYYVDGVFDTTHLGHFNAIRQSKEISRHLTVGVDNDADVTKVKAHPVLQNKERTDLLKHVKWVDNVMGDVPQSTSLEWMNEQNIKYVVHGDDLCTDEFGNDVFGIHKSHNRYKEVRRTRGVSSTNFIEKLLEIKSIMRQVSRSDNKEEMVSNLKQRLMKEHNSIHMTLFHEFIKGKADKKFEGTLYIQSSFDFLRFDHANLLARIHNLYPNHKIVVGVQNDQTIVEQSQNLPISTFSERILSLFALKYVDDVVFDPPLRITKEFIKMYDITKCVRNKSLDVECQSHGDQARDISSVLSTKYSAVENLIEEVEYEFELHLDQIIKRVETREEELKARNAKKAVVKYNDGFEEIKK